MKVAVYSGSFNPFHRGHLAVTSYLLEHAGFDQVKIVVSPRSPFKDGSMAVSAQQRLDTVRDIIKRHGLSERVSVDDIEFRMSLPSYTIRTLDALREREPKNKYSLVIGADNLPTMLDWREGTRILTEYGVVVYPREGFNMVHDCTVLKLKHRNAERLFNGGKHVPLHINLLKDAPQVDISSTEIRTASAEGKDISEYKL